MLTRAESGVPDRLIHALGFYKDVIITQDKAMNKRGFSIRLLFAAAIAAGLLVVLFYVLPYLYSYSENKNFEKLREKSTLNCETMPLHCLIRDNDIAGIADYINSRRDLERKDNWGRTALFWAFHKQKHDSVDRLLAAGANPNTKDENGISIFFQSVVSGEFDVSDQLLAHGADIDALNHNQHPETALHYCVMKDKPDCVKYLLQHGADKNIKDSFGYTVFDRIKTHEHISKDIEQLLRTNP